MVAYLNIAQAAELYGVSRRTIEKKISSGDIHASQIIYEGRNTKLPISELVRVFGEAKRQEKQVVKPRDSHVSDMRTMANDGESAMVALLRDQLEKAEALATAERERAERAETEWRRREKDATERAEKAERERAEMLEKYVAANETIRLLTGPKEEKKKGLFGRLFGK